MRFYLRTSRNTGVGVGPLGLLILGPIYFAWIVLLVLAFVIGAAVIVVAGLVRYARERRGGETTVPEQ